MRTILICAAFAVLGQVTALAQDDFQSLLEPKAASPSFCSATDNSVDLSNLLPNVGDIGNCGSSWAMAPAYALDAAYAHQGKKVQVSVQQIVSCDVTNGGCNGGDPLLAVQYMQDHPLASFTAYPYTSGGGKTGNCLTKSNYPYEVGQYQLLPGANSIKSNANGLPSVATMKAAMCAHGPLVSAASLGDGFTLYTGGVVGHANSLGTCAPANYNNLDAVVLIVGWDDKKQAWKVDPFYNSDFGVGGYVWVTYLNHTCALGAEAMWVAPK